MNPSTLEAKPFDAQKNDAPAIVKWQQVEQFKLQPSNSLTVGQSQGDAHSVYISVATREDVLEGSRKSGGSTSCLPEPENTETQKGVGVEKVYH